MSQKKYSSDVHNKYDKAYKELLEDPQNFHELLTHFIHYEWAKDAKINDLTREDTAFLTKNLKSRAADILYKLKIHGDEVYFYTLLEMQTKVDQTMPIRLFEYMGLILKRAVEDAKKNGQKNKIYPNIIPIVLYNGEEKWTVKRSLQAMLTGDVPGFKLPDFEYILIDVNAYSLAELSQDAGVISRVFSVEQSHNEIELAQNLLTNANQVVHDKQKYLALQKWLRITVTETVYQQIIEVLETYRLEGKTMETTRIQRIFDEASERRYQKGIKQGIEQGVEQGLLGVAKKLLVVMNDEEVAKFTELTIEEVQNLRKSLH